MGEDGYFAFGTPLDPYDEDEVPKKKSAFQDITEQYAYDSNGKRRFHGAFTGGFSAGHWNTVSTPEGWTPQSFKSTRSERMKYDQKAEDFMDEEDRSEFGIAPREVHTTKEFSGTKRSKQKSFHEGPIPGEPVLHKVLEPVHDTAAVIILKSMGWRPGRGIGEKVTKREKRAARKLYTCHIPAEFRQNIEQSEDEQMSSSDDEDLESQFSEILLEPDDFKPYVARPKTDTFGLGYTGLSRHSILGSKNEKNEKEWTGSHLITNDKGRKVSIRGQAFGVGALEEEDDDIYAREDMSNYDYSLEDAKKKIENSKANKTSFGRRVLEGFLPAKSEFKPSKIYPPPALPHDYVPNATKVRKTRFSDAVPANSNNTPIIRDRGLGRHDLTAQDRSKMLGESSNSTHLLPNTSSTVKVDVPKSIGKTYEERIAAITGRNINFTSNTNQPNADTESQPKNITSALTDSKTDESDQISLQLEKNHDKFQGFKPFASNPEKQLRYEKFVADKKDNKGKPQGEEGAERDRISNWEKMRELTEFEQAFRLYKPLTGAMGDRFTSAETQEDSPVEKTKAKTVSYFPNESNETLEAARTGMFGKLTRKVTEWKPDSLLCKRFNVPESGVSIPQKTEKKKLSYSIFEYLETPVHNRTTFMNEQNKLNHPNDKTDDKVTPPVWKPLARTINIEPEPSKIEEKIKDVAPVVKVVPDHEPRKMLDKPRSKRLTVAELFLQEKEKEREANAKANSSQKLQFQKELEEAIEDIDRDKKETIENFNKIDLYKAIFLSDDSDSDSNENVDKDAAKKNEVANVINVAPRNVERNPSPPKGIFANLNFEKMNSWRDNQTKNLPKSDDNKKTSIANNQKDSNKHEIKNTPEKVIENKIDDDIYGPRLPENLQIKPSHKVINESEAVEINSSSDSSDWVETDQVDGQKSNKSKKSSKKKKKSSKHHKSKHKTKKKHKKSKN